MYCIRILKWHTCYLSIFVLLVAVNADVLNTCDPGGFVVSGFNMHTYDKLLSSNSYKKLPGEERVDFCYAAYTTLDSAKLSGVLELLFISKPIESKQVLTIPTFSTVHGKHFIMRVPLGTMQSLRTYHRNIDDKTLIVNITCKDIRALVFNLMDPDRAASFFDKLKAYIYPAVSKLPLFAYVYGAKCLENNLLTNNGWNIYNPEEEFNRQNIFTNGWRITKINSDYRLCDTYPAVLAVPWEVTDELLVECAPHRSRGRIPVLSWLHPESKASLTRASQPQVGVHGRRSSGDEELVRLLRVANANANSLLIFDARPQVNAIANIGIGGGVENPSYYENVQYMFLNIHNTHTMRAALTKVFEACFPLPDDARWLKLLADSKWLYHIKQIIFAATSVADKIENHKTSVLIHCSDGWDRTAQVTSLAMLMLDPYYRTIRGFEVLIEKEWCSFGHKFAQRTGGPADGGVNLPASNATEIGSGRPSNADERSPIFLQFIDCVWQMTQQFPHSFEFNERFLITIMDEVYAARFGTFLFDCEMQGKDHCVREKTISVWAYINADVHTYQNPLYTPAEVSGHRVIFPQHALSQLQFWTGYYIRWHPLMRLQEPVARRDRSLILIMKRFRELTAASQREPNELELGKTRIDKGKSLEPPHYSSLQYQTTNKSCSAKSKL